MFPDIESMFACLKYLHTISRLTSFEILFHNRALGVQFFLMSVSDTNSYISTTALLVLRHPPRGNKGRGSTDLTLFKNLLRRINNFVKFLRDFLMIIETAVICCVCLGFLKLCYSEESDDDNDEFE